jgi:hypothetical protein
MIIDTDDLSSSTESDLTLQKGVVEKDHQRCLPKDSSTTHRLWHNEDKTEVEELLDRVESSLADSAIILEHLLDLDRHPELQSRISGEAVRQLKDILGKMQTEGEATANNAEVNRQLRTLVDMNQDLKCQMDLILSFYSPQHRERTRNELDQKAEAFVQKMIENRKRR